VTTMPLTHLQDPFQQPDRFPLRISISGILTKKEWEHLKLDLRQKLQACGFDPVLTHINTPIGRGSAFKVVIIDDPLGNDQQVTDVVDDAFSTSPLGSPEIVPFVKQKAATG